MNSVVVRTLFSLFVPRGLVVFTTAILLYMGTLDKSLSALVHIYPYAVAAAGLLLGWRFNRSRLVFAILVLALADRALLYFSAGSLASVGDGTNPLQHCRFSASLNLAALSLMQERGIITVHGIVRLSFMLSQAVVVYLICRFPQLGLAGLLTTP